jgi:integrase
VARRKALTDKMIFALPRKAKRYVVTDPEQRSLFLRIPPRGPATYTVIVKKKGRQTWASIGTTDDMGIDEARELARRAIKRVKAGQKAIEPPPKPPQSVAATAQNWLSRHVDKNKLRTAAEIRRVVNRYIIPHIGDADFTSLRRADIANLLDIIEDRHGPATADATLAVLRTIGSWVHSRDDTYVPPFVHGMRRVPKAVHERSRILSDDELRTVWLAADQAGPYGAILKLLLLTAQRRAKVEKMRWADISPDGIWTVPAEEREKGNGGRLKLPELALEIIGAQPQFASSPFVFAQLPSTRSKARFDRSCHIAPWRVHDLRRTSRSILARIGVAHEVAEAVLGHGLKGVAGIYNRHSFEIEKAGALAKLANKISQIVDPIDNVVALHEAAS